MDFIRAFFVRIHEPRRRLLLLTVVPAALAALVSIGFMPTAGAQEATQPSTATVQFGPARTDRTLVPEWTHCDTDHPESDCPPEDTTPPPPSSSSSVPPSSTPVSSSVPPPSSSVPPSSAYPTLPPMTTAPATTAAPTTVPVTTAPTTTPPTTANVGTATSIVPSTTAAPPTQAPTVPTTAAKATPNMLPATGNGPSIDYETIFGLLLVPVGAVLVWLTRRRPAMD